MFRIRLLFSNILFTIAALKNIFLNLNYIKSIYSNKTSSPLQKHLLLNTLSNFSGPYDEWRMKRVNKMLEIFGIDFFKNARILELGSGFGETGAIFAELGANVLCLEGRQQSVNVAKLLYRNLSNFRCEQHNLEDDFSHFGRFDLIIHFGVLYHLQEPKVNLHYCMKCSDRIILESAVVDSQDTQYCIRVSENRSLVDQSVIGFGSRFSPFFIESVFEEAGYSVQRHFTRDLNLKGFFAYDWKHRRFARGRGHLRRFWYFSKNTGSHVKTGTVPTVS
ncbi:MAG: methyltransferase [Fibrobacterota bacterium]